MEGARLLIFETACRIHKCMEMDHLFKCLCLPEDGAEASIVALIRESNINANIDSANKQLIVSTQKRSSSQQVIDLSKSRNLEHRSMQLIAQVKKKYAMLDGGHD
jgi:translation initiation factor 3 subunit E